MKKDKVWYLATAVVCCAMAVWSAAESNVMGFFGWACAAVGAWFSAKKAG